MEKRAIVLVCLALLLWGTVSAQDESTSGTPSGSSGGCGFFCKVKNFFTNLFSESPAPVAEKEHVEEQSNTDAVKPVIEDAGTSETSEPVVTGVSESTEDAPNQPKEAKTSPKTIEEIKEEAIEEQVEIVEERAAEVALADITVKNPKCTIDLAKDEVNGNENVKVDVVFDESLKYERVSISCDQFERYGKGSDEPYKTAVPSSLKIDGTNCDWGDVTTKTVYFVIVADKDDNDICAAPITVIPKKEDLDRLDEDGCFTEEALSDMKKNCGDLKPFSLPDARGCETVYCAAGEISQCTPEALLEKATIDCEAKGENFLAYKYSEIIAGQDWPCAQIRCSECPSEEELTLKEESCIAQGEDVEARRFIDHDVTGCPYIVCVQKEEAPIEELPPE